MRYIFWSLVMIFVAQSLNAAGIPLQSEMSGSSCASIVVPTSPPDQEQQNDEGDLDSLKAELERLKDFLESLPKSEAAKRIKDALERLGNEIERLQNSLRDTLEKEIVPWLRKEIDRLKNELFRYLEEPDEENKPRKVKVQSLCLFARLPKICIA